MADESNNVPQQNRQDEQNGKRVAAHLLATVMAGRGRLKTARTVGAHVHLAITLANTERRAADILYRGAILTPKPAPPSEFDVDCDIEVELE